MVGSAFATGAETGEEQILRELRQELPEEDPRNPTILAPRVKLKLPVVNAADPEGKVTPSRGKDTSQEPGRCRHRGEMPRAPQGTRSCDSTEDLAFSSADRPTGETTRLRGELTSITFQGAPREGTRLGSRGGEWIPPAFLPLNNEKTGIEPARIGLIRPRCRQAPNVDPEDFEPAAPRFLPAVSIGSALFSPRRRVVSFIQTA